MYVSIEKRAHGHWSVERSSLGQATNKRLSDHWVNNNIFYETFSNSQVDNVLGEVFHVQVQKDAKYLRKLMSVYLNIDADG